MGRKYWKKRSYVFQGFVTDNPSEDPPKIPIPDLLLVPIFNHNRLYGSRYGRIAHRLYSWCRLPNKASKGGYADYPTPTWARRERPEMLKCKR